MIKTGIYTIEGLIHEKKTDFFGKTKNISISLYTDLTQSDLPDKEKLQDLVLYNAKLIRFYKLTYGNRFEEFDILVNEVIERHYKNEKYFLKIHDAAVSDGRTSVEWYDALEKQKLLFSLTASDLCTELKLFKKGKIQVIFDSSGRLLQVVIPPFVFTDQKNEHRFYLINKALSYFFFKKFRNLDTGTNQFHGFQESILSQICTKGILYSQTKNNFKFIFHDLFYPMAEKYDVIRVMNVLQQAYFTDNEHTRILKNIYNSLNENSLFITGSNDVMKSPINAGIYTRKGSGFLLIKKINSGSRIHDLIQNFNESVEEEPIG